MNLADIGFIGLGVMGENLILNIEQHGFRVAVYNRTSEKLDQFLGTKAVSKEIIGTQTLEQLVSSIKKPRKVMLMIQAGHAVDDMIDILLEILDPLDIIIDGGNSHFEDTIRRVEYIEKKGLFFIGCGISGGEAGARHGASLMPGGSYHAWPQVEPIFNAIAAKAPDGSICCKWIGKTGAGHFVKMVHNAIEYGDMQLIAEAYHFMKKCFDFSAEQLHEIFSRWNKGVLRSYLIEITAHIFAQKDSDGAPLIDKIADTSSQKGTGQWTVITAAKLSNPLTLIHEAVNARFLSNRKQQRHRASRILGEKTMDSRMDPTTLVEDLEQALFCSKVVSYGQGFSLLLDGSRMYGWDLNYADIAAIWRAGCIIRSVFLDSIRDVFKIETQCENLLYSDYFSKLIMQAESRWRSIVTTAISYGIAVPAMASGLTYYDGFRTEHSPANLIAAQRDYFGAHLYSRIDHDPQELFHTQWTHVGE